MYVVISISISISMPGLRHWMQPEWAAPAERAATLALLGLRIHAVETHLE
jgi:hypothetical protein